MSATAEAARTKTCELALQDGIVTTAGQDGSGLAC